MSTNAAYEIAHDWEEPHELLELLDVIREARPEANIPKIRYAYYVAEKAHTGQVRSSGEPYIFHPLAVSRILLDLHMDDDTLVAALLHDVLEDCPGVNSESLRKTFGDSVVDMIEGVTKLKFKPNGDLSDRERVAAETNRTAETLRKMLLAMAKDFRVMVIKLADRLHNMQTLDSLPPHKRTRIANETLDVYAPLAARLGIWQLKWQLEDLAFKHLHPTEFQDVSERVAKTRQQREEELRSAIVTFKTQFEKAGLRGFEVNGRPKHLYSIFNKMVKQGLRFEEIYDLLAVRVVVEKLSECYIALGIVHETMVPIPGLFYDYIAKPKPNGYQSLHTKVVGPSGQPLEVQIRTRQMHEVAEYGVAAHWTYKEGSVANDETARLSRLREQLFDWSGDATLSSDFLRSVSTDLFSEQVFVFTPKGDVIDLPKNSTPVDFAFRVHTEVGLTLVGAKVNAMMVPLNTRLHNGDVIELFTRPNAQPSLDWLEFVQSSHARSRIKNFIRRQSKFQDAQRGREMLERELKSGGFDAKTLLGEDGMQAIVLATDGCETAVDVFAKVGQGLLSVQSVVQKLTGGDKDEKEKGILITRTREGKLRLSQHGYESILVHRAKCCSPIPGDEIVGYVTRGRGIMLHRKVCPNAMNFAAHESERLIAYDWPPDDGFYGVTLKIVTVNRQGLLMDISTILGETKTNVSSANIRTLPNQTAEIQITIDVTDTKHLAQVMNKISSYQDVISILRVFARTVTK